MGSIALQRCTVPPTCIHSHRCRPQLRSGLLQVTWRNGAHRATLHANLKDSSFHCEATEPQGNKMRTMKWMLGTEDCSEGCVPGEPPVKWEAEEMCSPPAV